MAAKAIRRKHLYLVAEGQPTPNYSDQLSLGEPDCPTENKS